MVLSLNKLNSRGAIWQIQIIIMTMAWTRKQYEIPALKWTYVTKFEYNWSIESSPRHYYRLFLQLWCLNKDLSDIRDESDDELNNVSLSMINRMRHVMLYVNITALNLCNFFSLIFQEIPVTPLERA